MFEGLDQIDWNTLGHHVYGGNEKIPDAIRNLLSQDPDIRDEARADLLGWGQEYGDITHITPYIIPFILEVLNSPDAPGKEGLLDHLSSVARNIWESNNLPVWKMRLYIKTYDSLKAGLNILISLLRDDSVAVQCASANLLQYMIDEFEILIPEFIKCCDSEKDRNVQLALLGGMKTLLHSLNWAHMELKIQCIPSLYKIIETQADSELQVAAAQTAVEIYERYFKEQTNLSPKVGEILSNEFLKVTKSIDYHKWSDGFEKAKSLIKDLARLEAEPLLEMLQNPSITPVQAHLIARGLLSNIMHLEANDPYWKYSRSIDKEVEGLYYLYNIGTAHNLSNSFRYREHGDRILQCLQALVDTEKVWAIPTNLFSFFYGLPDSREELRALLNSKSEQ